MVYRICGGIALLLLGLGAIGMNTIPTPLIGLFLLIGGVALLAGF